jgi:hypothetical protein
MNNIDHKTQEVVAVVVNGDGTLNYEVRERKTPLDVSTQHNQAITDQQWKAIRQDRNKLLTASDWVTAKAFEANVSVPPEWSVYRQALRDITKQSNPFKIEWPKPPE